jgi:predicted metal-dependent peptidase
MARAKKPAAPKAAEAPGKDAVDVAGAQEELSRCVIQLLLHEPFFGHLLGGVPRRADGSTPTACVSLEGGRCVLTVNPVFFLKTLRKGVERVAVVKHEALHLLFRHLLRLDLHRHDRLVFNLAADLVVNQFITSPFRLPEGAIVLGTFPDLGLEPDKTVEWYYDKLKCLRDEGSRTTSPKSKEAFDRIAGTSVWHSDHGRWGHGDAASQAVADTELDRLVVQARDRAGPRGYGPLPNALKELIAAALERRAPKVDWRRALRIFSASARRTRIAGTYQRMSRRYGTLPGIKVQRFQRMAVVLDTSGSISDDDLSEFFAEVHALWRNGAEVTVLEADAAVQHVWRYAGRLPGKVGGRGGTSFDPAFQWLQDARRQGVWDGCIYLTDGVAPTPTVRPPCKLLWVLTRDGKGENLPWGRVVKLV